MKSLNGVKAVTFDVDGTLWDFERVMRRSLGKVLDELGRHDAEAAALLSVDTLVETRDRVHESLKGRVTDLNELRRESFRQALTDVDRPDEALEARMTAVYFKHRDKGRRPFPDVLPALQALEGRYRLGTLSNGNTYPADLGLDGLFAFSVVGQDHGGIEKPDRRLFEIALQKAGCLPHGLVHVGDSPDHDVAGAGNAGIKSIWLNRNGQAGDSGVRPDYEISSLRELVAIL